MKRKTLLSVAFCLMMIAIVGGAASGVAATLSSLPGYADALAAANGTTSGTTPSGSLRSMPGYQDVLNNSRVIQGSSPSGSLRSLPGYQDALDQWKGMPGATIYPGTIQRVAGVYCYALTYTDASQTTTVHLPANGITYAAGGSPLPNTIPDPVAVDYVSVDNSHFTVNFRYQGVYYTAKWYTACPYQAPVMTVTGTYSPYVKGRDAQVYDWYLNLHMVSTWDASHLPPGVLLERISWSINGSKGDGTFPELVGQYIMRSPGFPDYGIPPHELPVVSGTTIDDGYTWLGYYGETLGPSNTWKRQPPFIGTLTITTTDGNSYTKTVTLTPAS